MKKLLLVLVLITGTFFSCNTEKKLQKEIDKSTTSIIKHPDKYVDLFNKMYSGNVHDTVRIQGKEIITRDTVKGDPIVIRSKDTVSYYYPGETRFETKTRVDTFLKDNPKLESLLLTERTANNKKDETIQKLVTENINKEKSKDGWQMKFWLGILIALIVGFILGKIF